MFVNNKLTKISIQTDYPFSLYDFKCSDYNNQLVDMIGYKIADKKCEIIFSEDVKSLELDKKYHRFFKRHLSNFEKLEGVLKNDYASFEVNIKEIKFKESNLRISLKNNKYLEKQIEKLITDETELFIDGKNVHAVSYRFNYYSHTIDTQDCHDIKKSIMCKKPFSILELKPLKLTEGYYFVGKSVNYEVKPLIFNSTKLKYETLDGFKGLINSKFLNINTLPLIPVLKESQLNILFAEDGFKVYFNEIKDSNSIDFKKIEFTKGTKANGFFIKADKNIKNIIIVPISNTNYGHIPLVIERSKIVESISYQHTQLNFKDWFLKNILGIKPEQTLAGKINGIVLYDYKIHNKRIESWFMDHFQIISS